MSNYLKHIFPINIYHGSVQDNNKIKELIIPLIEEHRKGNKHTAPKGWLTDKLITSFSDDDFNDSLKDDSTPIGKELSKQYNPIFADFFDRSFSIQITDMWYNFYDNGEYQEAHCHFGNWKTQNHFACIHFLNYDHNKHSPLKLLDPTRHIRISSWEFFDKRNYTDQISLNVKEGDFIMIPAYLEHEVSPGIPTPDYPRITISFNISVIDIDEDNGDEDTVDDTNE
tara:strand:+ start:4117 stop:4794 length:678 start_codon:yes stop_codon:yes gene_type:complete